jgi:diguanylate cyclase
VNDTLGHSAGDSALKIISERLRRVAGDAALLGRIGGDEFALYTPIQDDEDELCRAEAFRGVFRDLVSISDACLSMRSSVGIALFPDHASTATELLSRADAAVHDAKRDGAGTCRLFDFGITERLERRRQLQQDLRGALERDEFRLYLQPEIDLQTGALIGAEGLIRWFHPERGLIPPSGFISFAEETGLIREIGAWTLEQACRVLPRLVSLSKTFRLYVNLSASELADPSFLERLNDTVAKSHVSTAHIGFEVTETMAMTNPALALATIAALKKQGFSVAIDDFGTGYSSLAYLTSLKPNVIKIDKSFVTDIADNSDSAALVQTVVLFAKKTGRRVLAEGVETSSQMNVLRAMGVSYAQGYLIAKPMPVESFTEWARRWAIRQPSTAPLADAGKVVMLAT